MEVKTVKVIVISAEPYLSNFLRFSNPNLDIAAVVMIMEEQVYNADTVFDDGRHFKLYHYFYLQECLKEIDYDYIIISLATSTAIDGKVVADLAAYKVDANKIFRVSRVSDPHILKYNSMFDWLEKDISKTKF